MSLLYLSLLGGWVAADNVSMVQSMISRPLAAGILAGDIVNHVAEPVALIAAPTRLDARRALDAPGAVRQAPVSPERPA